MLLSLAEHVLEVQTWTSKDELLRCVGKCDGGMVILGENASQEVDFYSVTVHFNYSARVEARSDPGPSCWALALISEGHGLKPHVLMLPNKVLVFGFNQNAIGFSAADRRELFRFSFDSLFRSFLYLTDQKIVLVLNEIGVVAITEDGQELWRYEKDVITDCSIKKGRLFLEFMDSPPVTLDLTRGLTVPNGKL